MMCIKIFGGCVTVLYRCYEETTTPSLINLTVLWILYYKMTFDVMMIFHLY